MNNLADKTDEEVEQEADFLFREITALIAANRSIFMEFDKLNMQLTVLEFELAKRRMVLKALNHMVEE